MFDAPVVNPADETDDVDAGELAAGIGVVLAPCDDIPLPPGAPNDGIGGGNIDDDGGAASEPNSAEGDGGGRTDDGVFVFGTGDKLTSTARDDRAGGDDGER